MNGTQDRQVPLRVLTMIDSLAAGGAERVAVELACALDRTRFAPHVVVTRGSGPLQELLDRSHTPYTILDRKQTVDLGAWRTVRGIAKNADIVHAHKLGSAAWGALATRFTNRPLIAHEHNWSAQGTTMQEFVERHWVMPSCQRYVCVSTSVANAVLARGGDMRKVQVVPNGVRMQAATARPTARMELGLPQAGFVVGITGALRPEKGHEVLLEAFAQLRSRNLDVLLCVLGDGPRREELQAFAQQLGVAQSVIWAGERPNAARLASAFDVSVIASHWEGMPLAALEALAAGVPLVATAVGGLPELLADGCGMLVPAGDPGVLGQAIAHVGADPHGAQTMAARGQQRVASVYSFEGMVETVQRIYVELAGPDGAERLARALRNRQRAA